jgi:hypothetical protein
MKTSVQNEMSRYFYDPHLRKQMQVSESKREKIACGWLLTRGCRSRDAG